MSIESILFVLAVIMVPIGTAFAVRAESKKVMDWYAPHENPNDN